MTTDQIAKIQAFFLEAAGQCYAGDLPKTTIAELPGSKVYRFEQGDLLYIDTYFTNDEHSGGQTVIYQDGTPVWLMQYQGLCKNDDPEVLSFLKDALRQTYCAGVWNNGRGPQEHAKYPYVYDNLVYKGLWEVAGRKGGRFDNFMGIEMIRDLSTEDHGEGGEMVFHHRYQGTLLARTEGVETSAVPDTEALELPETPANVFVGPELDEAEH